MNYDWSWKRPFVECNKSKRRENPDNKSINVKRSLIKFMFIRVKFNMATRPSVGSLTSLLISRSVVDVAAMSSVKLSIMVLMQCAVSSSSVEIALTSS